MKAGITLPSTGIILNRALRHHAFIMHCLRFPSASEHALNVLGYAYNVRIACSISIYDLCEKNGQLWVNACIACEPNNCLAINRYHF